MSKSLKTVVFSHGKESGPWGSKITAMAQIAKQLGLEVESVDYRGMDDPAARVEKLLASAKRIEAPLLVGSSMGGHVSAAAASALAPSGMFLLAPAFYMQGFEAFTPRVQNVPTVIVHGWHDDIVPVENSIRWAHEHNAALHLLNSNHRLEDKIPEICELLRDFVKRLSA